MVVRFTVSAVALASVLGVSAASAASMNADEARRFVANKVFAFTCFDGTRGAGRVFEDGSAAGSVQFSGSGPIRHMRLPGNTLQTRGQAICASLKGIPFEPCFNLDKTTDVSFRGSVSGMGFAYCEFRHQGAQQMLLARAVARPRSLRAPPTRADAPYPVVSKVETPAVESAKLEPVKPAAPTAAESKPESPKAEPAKVEAPPELRRSTD